MGSPQESVEEQAENASIQKTVEDKLAEKPKAIPVSEVPETTFKRSEAASQPAGGGGDDGSGGDGGGGRGDGEGGASDDDSDDNDDDGETTCLGWEEVRERQP